MFLGWDEFLVPGLVYIDWSTGWLSFGGVAPPLHSVVLSADLLFTVRILIVCLLKSL